MKTTYYVATSLDGFIADSDKGVEWLDRIEIDHQASEYEAFFASIDGLLMGRKTFDFVYDYGQWPYGDRPTWVCSNREIPLMKGCNLQTARSPRAAMDQAKEQGIQHLMIMRDRQQRRLVSPYILKQDIQHMRLV